MRGEPTRTIGSIKKRGWREEKREDSARGGLARENKGAAKIAREKRSSVDREEITKSCPRAWSQKRLAAVVNLWPKIVE